MNMNQTAYRVFFVMTVVCVCCAIYVTVLVQFAEVPVPKISKKSGVTKPLVQVESPFAPYFQEGAWECTPNAAHLITSQNIVMFFRNITMAENEAQSDECTILIAPGEKTFPMTPKRGIPFYPIRVNIYEGAEIQLDPGSDQLSPTPVGGRLNGPVQISYKVRLNGFLTDCLVRTSDLICDMKSLQTSRSVEFFLGTFSAKGSQFKLIFQKSLDQEKFFSGISSVELGHLEHMTLRLSQPLLQQLNLKMSPEMKKRIQEFFGQNMEIPITLHCDGPMFYDVKEGVIKFSRKVRLSCDYPNAPKDTLTCEELELHLAPDLEKRFLNAGQPSVETAEPREQNQTFANPSEWSESSDVRQAGNAATDASQTDARKSTEGSNEDSGADSGEDSGGSKESEVSSNAVVSPENESAMEEFPLSFIQAKQNVRLNIPTFNASAEAENLIFYTENQTLQLSGSQQAAIIFDQHEFHAFNISYTFPPQNTNGLGEIQCDQRGGWLQTRISSSTGNEISGSGPSVNPSRDPQSVTVKWNESLRGIPRESGRYDFYVTGSVLISSPKFGSLSADSISARLRSRTPEDEKNDANLALELGGLPPQTSRGEGLNPNPDSAAGKKLNFIPEFVIASGNVRLKVEQESASLDAQLTKIQFMFQKPPHIPDVLLQVRKARAKEKAENEQSDSPCVVEQPARTHDSSSSRDFAKRNFNLVAGELWGMVQLLPGEEGFFVPQLSLTAPTGQELVLREEAPLQTSEQLISLHAQKILLQDLLPETLQCEITGSNAVLSGFGVRLECAKMAVNCASNRIDVNCPGKMSVFTRQKAGTNLNYSTLMETVITWQKSLTFNGLEVAALENVMVKTPTTSLRMDCVQALLTERIQLNKPPKFPGGQEVIDFFQTIAAKHNVKLIHQNFDQSNHLTSVCTLETNLLNFFPGNKKICMNGRGTLSVSYLGNAESPFQAHQEEEKIPVQVTPPPQKWNQVRMEYNGGISGDLLEGEFVIKDRISALMQPVPRPDFVIPQTHIEPRMLPEEGFQFTCDQVTIDKIPSLEEITSQRPPLEDLKLEVKAEGNVKFETSTISVDGVTLKYSQEKNTCHILGDERTRVYIIQQEFVGGKRNEMTTDGVEVNLKNMHLNLTGVTMQGSY